MNPSSRLIGTQTSDHTPGVACFKMKIIFLFCYTHFAMCLGRFKNLTLKCSPTANETLKFFHHAIYCRHFSGDTLSLSQAPKNIQILSLLRSFIISKVRNPKSTTIPVENTHLPSSTLLCDVMTVPALYKDLYFLK